MHPLDRSRLQHGNNVHELLGRNEQKRQHRAAAVQAAAARAMRQAAQVVTDPALLPGKCFVL